MLRSCSRSSHGRDTPTSKNRANVIWLGQRKDGCHHVVALISKPWLRKRKRFTEVAASRGLVFPSDSGRSETLMMKTGQLNRTLPSVFSPVAHFRVYCERSFRCSKQFHNTFKTPTCNAVSKYNLFTQTFTTQFSCVSLFSGSQQKHFWISSIKLPVQF